jgi:hypothetical protein
MDGFVYFVQPIVQGQAPTKIGWSTNPWAQCHEGQRWTWFQMRVVAVVEVPKGSPFWGTTFYSLERLLHDALRKERIAREWFATSDRVTHFIDAARAGSNYETVARVAIEALDNSFVRSVFESNFKTRRSA